MRGVLRLHQATQGTHHVRDTGEVALLEPEHVQTCRLARGEQGALQIGKHDHQIRLDGCDALDARARETADPGLFWGARGGCTV